MFSRIDEDQSLLKEKAFRYRISLINQSFTEEEERELIRSFFSRMNFNLSNSFFMSGLKPISVTRSQKVGRDFKNAMTYLYFYNKSKEREFSVVDLFISETEKFLLAGYDEVNKLRSKLSSSFLEHKESTSRIIKKNYFENNSALRKRENADPRMSIGFSSYQNLSSEKSCLKLPEYLRKKVKAKEVFLLEEKSFLGNLRGPIQWGNINNIQEEEDTFDFVVFQRTSFANGRTVNPKDVSVTLLFDFVGNEKINEISIKNASINEVLVDKILCDENEITFYKKKNSEGISLYFEPVKVTKVEIVLSQPTYLDFQTLRNESNENRILRNTNLRYVEEEALEENGLIYDLSLKEVSFFYTSYRKKGIYVDAEEIEVSGPLSAKLDVSYLKDRETVFVEKYLQVTLFGENNLSASNRVYQNLRFDKKIPIPSGEEEEKEFLIIRNRRAELRFESKSEPKVYKNNVLVSNQDYTWRRNAITFKPNVSVKKTDIFYAVYKIVEGLNLENNLIEVKNGKIIFKEDINSCSGTLLPIIIMRSGVEQNDDTDIIKEVTLRIEENENIRNVSIRRDAIRETSSRGNSNVSQ